MYSQYLPVIMSNAVLDAAEMLPKVINGDVTLREMLSFCQHYRIKGICLLFLEGTPETLYMELHNSAHAFLYFLKNKDDADKATSMAAPFFDALAANDLQCAREIAQNSRQTWNNEEEYEDDFLYVFFLMKHFFLNGQNFECKALLDRFESVLEGASDVKFDLCRAFLDNEETAFEEALVRFLEQWGERYKWLISRDAIPQEVAATEANLNVEGLALLRLAETKGFETQENYLFIPSVARKDVSIVFEPNSWKNPH
jgi:hypothetical protein